MNIEQIHIKQYDTINISCEYLGDDGLPLSLDGVSIFADLQTTSGALVDSFVVTIPQPLSGQFNLTPTVTNLDVGSYRVDLLFQNNDSERRVSSETFGLVVKSAITKPRV